jgi:hypothetical protein
VGSIHVGGLPNPDLQRLSLQLLDTHIEYDLSLTFAWGPRDQNVQEDYLSHEYELIFFASKFQLFATEFQVFATPFCIFATPPCFFASALCSLKADNLM